MYALYAALIPAVSLIFTRVILLFLVVYHDLPANRPGDEPGEHTMLSAILDIPDHIQAAVVAFPLFIFAARILTWIGSIAYEKDEIPESREDRKRRIRESYGIED